MDRAGTIAAIVFSAVLTPAMALAQSNGNGRATSREQMRFRAMDTDHDGVITRAEWTGDDQSFRDHDLNHDGVLSGDEVSPRVVNDGSDQSRRQEMAARFERADRNGDGQIARREWTGTTAAFKRLDQDGDGNITRDEYFAVMQTTGTSGSPNATTSQNAATAQTTTRAYRAGYDKGLVEGRQAGKEDKNVNGGHWDLDGQRELEQADSGYTQDLGARTDYQAGYRAGFRTGYREGFGPRR
jgi:Ca2+-binding EF-hand superfamily protein